MKKVSIVLSLIALVCFTNAQQTAGSSVTHATPIMKADAKPVPAADLPIHENAMTVKGSCQNKPAAECKHDSKTCSKEVEGKACCKKNGTAQTCNHGVAEKEENKKQ